MFNSLLILQGISSTSCHSGQLPVLVVGSQFHRTRLSRRTPIPASVLAYVAERQPSDTLVHLRLQHHTPGLSARNITTIRQQYYLKSDHIMTGQVRAVASSASCAW